MKPLTIRNRFEGNNTLVENEFIDKYMINANGEYVKVYLLLLRHLNNPSATLTISTIADCLEDTEKDILRALNYWAKKGLLTIEHDASGKVTGLDIGKVAEIPPLPDAIHLTDVRNSVQEQPLALPSSVPDLPSYKSRKEFKDVLYATECYLGKTLNQTEVQTITYFYDNLHFPTSLIEYLIEYCVDNGHKSMRYMKTVAIAWSEKGITTIAQAKEDVAAHSAYNKDCNVVLKAYGISNRFAGTSELAYIRKWTKEYGFTLDIVEEACRRTLTSTHQPSFPHTDKILSTWLAEHVETLADIKKLDQTYQEQKTTRISTAKQKRKASTPSATSRFNNFEGRSYDMDELEKKLLNTN